MRRTGKRKESNVELMLNEIAADQVVNRLVIQCMLLNFAGADGPEMLAGIKEQVLSSVARALPQSDDRQGDERRRQLTLMRAETLFLEIEEALGRDGTTADTSSVN